MIHHALRFVTESLNTYLNQQAGNITTPSRMVHLTNVAAGDSISIPDRSIGVSLVNIEEERVFKEQRSTVINEYGRAEIRNPELKLNLYVLVSANFTREDGDTTEDYIEGLKQLSQVIEFFQGKNVFTNENSPYLASLDPSIQKLIVEFYSHSFEQMYNFWSVLGGNYLPSVLYRVRLLTVQKREVLGSNNPIEKIIIKDPHL
ncbi:MAG: DUF4255 domain-containing protein [Bacteroidota bacterium]